MEVAYIRQREEERGDVAYIRQRKEERGGGLHQAESGRTVDEAYMRQRKEERWR